VLGLQATPHSTGNSNERPDRFRTVDGLGVLHPRKARLDELLEPRDRLLVDPFREERHVVGALVEDRTEAVPEQILGQVRIGRDVGERDFGSTIQNSERWRLVFEFSARNVGPKV